MQKMASSSIGFLISSTIVAVLMMFSSVVAIEFTEFYGYSLFLLGPFLAGFISVLLYSSTKQPTVMDALLIPNLSCFLLGLLFFVIGFEGLTCIMMLLPLFVPLSICGGFVGYGFAKMIRNVRDRKTTAMLLLPTFWVSLAVEPEIAPTPPVRKVVTSIVIEADAQTIWDVVVAFPRIEKEPDGVFRWGISYPISADIEGRGVGAMRYCRFNNGDFVEPITVWDEPKLLAFDVTENPIPMKEWSFYGDIDPPHLHGAFVSERGQFHLIDLGNGKVKLEGTTWYHQDLWPNFYWGFLADRIIHRIHVRVLDHIKELAEREPH